MSHVYQPLVIRALVEADGTATLRQLALALVAQDEPNAPCCREDDPQDAGQGALRAPSERPMSGSRFGPKISSARIRTTISSAGPMLGTVWFS